MLCALIKWEFISLLSHSLLPLSLFLSCQSGQVQSVCSSILSEDTVGGRGGGAGEDEGSRGERVL